MTIDELKDKVPPELKPWVADYGPALLAMTGEEIKSWLDLLVRGRVDEAYQAVLAKMPNGDLLAEWTTVTAEWKAANAENAARMSVQKQAMATLMKILLSIALVAVGL